MEKVKFPRPENAIFLKRNERLPKGVKVCTKTARRNPTEKGSPNFRTLRDELKGTRPIQYNGGVYRPVGPWIDSPNTKGEYITNNRSVFKYPPRRKRYIKSVVVHEMSTKREHVVDKRFTVVDIGKKGDLTYGYIKGAGHNIKVYNVGDRWIVYVA